MKSYQKRLAILLAESGALFFRNGLKLKDGRPTPYFINLGAFHNGYLTWELALCFAEWIVEQGIYQEIDVLVGPSYKGSFIAQAITIALYQRYGLNLAFEYDRKEAKKHGESSFLNSMFVTGALTNNSRILIVDDVATSMSTKINLLAKLNAEQKLQKIKLKIKGVLLAVDREQLQPSYNSKNKSPEDIRQNNAINTFTSQIGLPVWAILTIRKILNTLFLTKTPVLIEGTRQPLNKTLFDKIYNYLDAY